MGTDADPGHRAPARSRLVGLIVAPCAAVTIVLPLAMGVFPGGGGGSGRAGTTRAGGVEQSAPAAASPSTSYPYSIASRIGPWGFPTRHATDYVAWRLYEHDVAFQKAMTGPNGRTADFGEPAGWAASAARIGLKVDGLPAPGSVAQWNAGEGGAGPDGHVAYVEAVNPDGSVLVSEFDWSVEYGYSERGGAGAAAVRAPRYIHIGHP
jgi:surface antigen